MGPLPQPLPQAGGGSLIPLPQSPQPLRPPKHLPARNLLGEVHPLQPRPFPRLAQQRLDIELALRVMRDHPIGRPAHPYLPRQRPRIEARKPDPSVRLHPLTETLHRPEIAGPRTILPPPAAQGSTGVDSQTLLIASALAT